MSFNPCKGCTVNCCNKMGLFLPQSELLQHFQRQDLGVVTRQVGKIFVVSPKDGEVCPYLEGEGCGIYAERPIDCQVYPYVMSHIIEKRDRVKIVFHTRSDCPQREALYRLMPESQARDLIVAFGKKIFGEEKTIVPHREGGFFSQRYHRAEARVFRYLNKYALNWSQALKARYGARILAITSCLSTLSLDADLGYCAALLVR